MDREIRTTAHAIERWQERVDPASTWLAAHLATRKGAGTGTVVPISRSPLRIRVDQPPIGRAR